jgi:hypothetical protein
MAPIGRFPHTGCGSQRAVHTVLPPDRPRPPPTQPAGARSGHQRMARRVVCTELPMKSLAAILVALAPMPDAPSNCVSATNDYAAAVFEVTDALRTYEQCVTASLGRSQCAEEFEELNHAQQDFETAAEKVVQGCPLPSPASGKSQIVRPGTDGAAIAGNRSRGVIGNVDLPQCVGARWLLTYGCRARQSPRSPMSPHRAVFPEYPS